MKNLAVIIFSSIILISCTKPTTIKEIEILSYYTNARHFETYTSIDKNGLAETLYKSVTSDTVDYYQSSISKNLIDSIFIMCNNKTSEDFKFKRSKRIMYDGFLKSVQITYDNGDKLDFQYPYADSINLQFKLFEEVLKQIRKDSLTGNRIFNRSGYLYSKQKELSSLTFKKDSIKYKLLYAK